MLPVRSPIEQTDPPRSPRETLPTMYDLPSEDPEEPGLPDEYHYLQPQLLSATFRLTNYSSDQVFSVGDMNLYTEGNWIPTDAEQEQQRAEQAEQRLRDLGIDPRQSSDSL